MTDALTSAPYPADEAAARLHPAALGDALADVDTPALIVDLDALESNIACMARAVQGRGVRLRPHAKSHKCPPIARLQIDAGAVGICCQKVSEAEAFAAGGVHDILITNEIVGSPKLRRLAALAQRVRLGVLVDDVSNVQALAAAMREADATIEVLIEIDVGAGRCGVDPRAGGALRLAQAIAAEPRLRFGGLHAYQGAAQHLRQPVERAGAIEQAAMRVAQCKAQIEGEGIVCATITGAGTGTFTLERDSGVYTELQPGSYVFMDADYARNQPAVQAPVFGQSLFVWTTVMSCPTRERSIVDAGLKASSVDSGLPRVTGWPGVEYVKASDEHGVLAITEGSPAPQLGDKLQLVPGHCDPTVNLYNWLIGVRDDRVEALWPVAARGALR